MISTLFAGFGGMGSGGGRGEDGGNGGIPDQGFRALVGLGAISVWTQMYESILKGQSWRMSPLFLIVIVFGNPASPIIFLEVTCSFSQNHLAVRLSRAPPGTKTPKIPRTEIPQPRLCLPRGSTDLPH